MSAWEESTLELLAMERCTFLRLCVARQRELHNCLKMLPNFKLDILFYLLSKMTLKLNLFKINICFRKKTIFSEPNITSPNKWLNFQIKQNITNFFSLPSLCKLPFFSRNNSIKIDERGKTWHRGSGAPYSSKLETTDRTHTNTNTRTTLSLLLLVFVCLGCLFRRSRVLLLLLLFLTMMFARKGFRVLRFDSMKKRKCAWLGVSIIGIDVFGIGDFWAKTFIVLLCVCFFFFRFFITL